MATHAPITGALSCAPKYPDPLRHRSYQPPLLKEVEYFLSATNMNATQFGKEALHDPRFVHDLRNGRDPRSRTVAIVRRFMAGGEGR